MRKRITYLIVLVLFVSLVSCGSYYSIASISPPSATTSGPRTLMLDGDSISAVDVGGFQSWVCTDYINEGNILVEVGFFGDPIFEGLGFILYDGGYSGKSTTYEREGLDHQWRWAGTANNYAFVINPDGTGLYYDFSGVPEGELTKANDVFVCKQR